MMNQKKDQKKFQKQWWEFGKVNVLITYTQSSEVIAMYNENNTVSHTSETDSEGRYQNY